MDGEVKSLGVDCGGQQIKPVGSRLTMRTNRHPNTDGTLWGWIEGCTSNICWSNNKSFNQKAAGELVREFNARAKKPSEP